MAPRGFDGALKLANVGDSVTARYDGGRAFCKAAGCGAKSDVLVEAGKSGVLEEAADSGGVGVSGGGSIAVVRVRGD